jgi:antirestriction protein ArdC
MTTTITIKSNEVYKNYTTGKFYQGDNHATLKLFSLNMNFTEPDFLTYRQALGIGRVVKKGETGVTLFRPCMVKKENEKTGEIKLKNSRKFFSVFNISQTTKLVDTDAEPEGNVIPFPNKNGDGGA